MPHAHPSYNGNTNTLQYSSDGVAVLFTGVYTNRVPIFSIEINGYSIIIKCQRIATTGAADNVYRGQDLSPRWVHCGVQHSFFFLKKYSK